MELDKTTETVKTLGGENAMLKAQVLTYKDIEKENAKLNRKYEDIVGAVKVSQLSQTDHSGPIVVDDNTEEVIEEEVDNIAVLVQNKQSGYRRSDPATHATTVETASKSNIGCKARDYKAKDDAVSKKHFQCDICSTILNSPESLRSHLKRKERHSMSVQT